MGIVLFDCIIGALGPIFLKLASNTFSLNPLKMIKNKNLILGVSFYLFGSVIFITALKFGELSVLYPLASITHIFVCFYSMKFLGEKMNKIKWTGIVLIMIGVSFIGFGSV
jgi:uncharacterized membrane protein